MDGKLKGHAALWVANIIWGLNAPIGKSVLWSETHPQGVSPFALSVYRMLGACLLFWTVSLFLPREKVAPRDIVLLLFASVFGIQLNQMLFLWGLSLTSPIDTSIIATIVPVLTMVLATLFLREPITWLKHDLIQQGCAVDARGRCRKIRLSGGAGQAVLAQRAVGSVPADPDMAMRAGIHLSTSVAYRVTSSPSLANSR